MIRTWKIRNFKSVGEANLSLAPLTLFAGANSSGKSTLLQSILLIAQTLAARGTAQTVVLNGHIIKLGQFDDLRNTASSENVIEIAWTIQPERLDDLPALWLRRMHSRISSISSRLVFGLSDEPQSAEQLNPVLHQFSLTCALRNTENDDQSASPPTPSFIRLSRTGPEKPEEELNARQRSRTRVNFRLAIDLDDDSFESLREDFTDAEPVGCALQAFLPEGLVIRFDERREIIRAIEAMLRVSGRARYSRGIVNSTKAVIPETLLTDLLRRTPTTAYLFPSDRQSDRTRCISVQEFVDHIRRNFSRSALTPEFLTELGEGILRALPAKREITMVQLPGDSLDNAMEFSRDYFTRRIKYLGPLREEPKALYPLQSTADPQEVGLHGEHTAAVFHRFRYSEVTYIPTACFEVKGQAFSAISVTLEEAVLDWLRYLTVAEGVTTTDEGKFGYGLKVKMASTEASHDLTHVGVGVSQVVPIVVMCLLAGRDTTIVLEQPELHLNPKVQTRLADFFLSLAFIQKQCLIETHSEYLINRLRLRAVLAPGTSVSDVLKLYFVEKSGGRSIYRDVMINEFGTIMRWPRDFFDQNQREIEHILIAAEQKTK